MANIVLRRLGLVSGCLAFGALVVPQVFAQTASQITPETYVPREAPQAQGRVAIPQAAGLDAPEGSEGYSITLSRIHVEGGFSSLSGEVQAVTNRFSGRSITVAQLFEAAREVQAVYARHGYVLVRVTVPEQDLRHRGTARFVVVDGFIEHINVDNLHKNVRWRVASLLKHLEGRRGVTLSQIERALLLAGDVPGLQLRSVLAAGSQPGASVLAVNGYYQAITGQVTLDTSLSSNLGWGAWGAGLQANSVFGFGELIYVSLNGDPGKGYFDRYARNRALAAGFVLPLGNDGFSLNIEAVSTRATPDRAALALGTTSEFERYSARLRYAFTRTRTMNVNLEASFDIQEESQLAIVPLKAQLFLDRLRVFRVKADGSWYAPWGGAVRGSVRTSFGIDGLGARSAADATLLLPLSRQGADADFKSVEVDVGYSQQIVENLVASFTARAQTSFNSPLLTSEQFSLTGHNGLSTFDSGSLRGDSGYVVRAELSSPWSRNFGTVGLTFSPYIFGAIGEAHLEAPTVLEESNVKAVAYGLGMRLAAAQSESFRNAQITLEWGRADRNDVKKIDDRFSVTASFQF